MKYFIVEGNLINQHLINDEIMKEHMAYTQKAMDKSMILISGLKEDMSGGIFTMKAECIEEIHKYLNKEPFNIHGIQEYNIIEFSPHYFNKSPNEWFSE